MEKEKAEGRKASADGQISFGALNDEEVLSRLRKTNPDEFSPADAKLFLQEICDMLK